MHSIRYEFIFPKTIKHLAGAVYGTMHIKAVIRILTWLWDEVTAANIYCATPSPKKL